MPACHAGGRRFEPVPGRHFFILPVYVVGVVKWLRPRVVAPVYVGSNPTIHPIFQGWFHMMTQGYRQVVRQWILIPSCAGSNPATPAIFLVYSIFIIWRHGQVVRQRSAKPLFPGSNPGVASIQKPIAVYTAVGFYFFEWKKRFSQYCRSCKIQLKT